MDQESRDLARLDVVIVGAGPAGIAAGAQAAARGLSHVVLERGRLANTVHRYQKGKHVMDEPPSLGLRSEIGLEFSAGTREQVLEAWERGTTAAGTNLRTGAQCEVTAVEGSQGEFVVSLNGGERIACANLVLAIGLQGNLRTFGIPGDDSPHVLYQLDDPDEHVDKRVLVVGAGDAAIENALALADQNEVAIVNRRDEFPRAKPRNRTLVEAEIKAGRIAHYVNSVPKRIESDLVVLDSPDGEISVEVDLVIGRLGATPPRSFLEKIGVEFPSTDAGAVPGISERYESNVPGVYIVGALAGYPLIKSCMNQGYEVIEHILGNHVEPADTPLLAEKFAELDGDVSEILDRIQARLPIFRTITNVQLREFLVDSTVHRVPAGETVYLRNDFSDSFYSIFEGAVRIVIPEPEPATGTPDVSASEPIDDIILQQGQFFGEMSLISGRRRSATVVADTECYLVETPRLAMIKLMRSVPDVSRIIDSVFVLRKLQTSLAPNVPLDDLWALATLSEIETCRRGSVLFEEGDESDGLHLIRRGSVTVSREKGGGEQILAYLPAGNIVGEMAFFAPDGRRNATVRATIDCETIRLPTDVLQDFLEEHPELIKRLASLEGERLVENAMRASDRKATGVVDFLMNAGAGEATDILLIDEALCVRCDNCETACASTHDGISRLDREAGPTFATVHIPTSCRHCENPKCMTDCPTDVIHRHTNGEVWIDTDGCIGCGNCSTNCPYGVIQLAKLETKKPRNLFMQLMFGDRTSTPDPDAKTVAVKCDLCRNLPSPVGAPAAACVSSCPTGAIIRVNPKRYVDESMGGGD